MKSNIKCIIEFGSQARGDYDEYSDHDFCIFIKKNSRLQNSIEKQLIDLPELKHINLSVTNIVVYNEETLIQMLNEGSLFLLHLKTEGNVLYGDKYFKRMLSSLKQFNKHIEDINYHEEILKDLINSQIAINKKSPFDDSLLFTIVRNTCTLLCHKYETPKFGRLDVFYTCCKIFSDFPFEKKDYLYLANKKMHYERGIENILIMDCEIKSNNILKKVSNLVNYAKNKFRNN